MSNIKLKIKQNPLQGQGPNFPNGLINLLPATDFKFSMSCCSPYFGRGLML